MSKSFFDRKMSEFSPLAEEWQSLLKRTLKFAHDSFPETKDNNQFCDLLDKMHKAMGMPPSTIYSIKENPDGSVFCAT